MKRYIKSAEDSAVVERANRWYDKVKRAVYTSELGDIIETYEPDEHNLEYPCVYVTLKAPYVVRYYSRVGVFLDYFTIAPNQADYVSPGSPDLVFVLPETGSDTTATAKIEKLYNKILMITERAESANQLN